MESCLLARCTLNCGIHLGPGAGGCLSAHLERGELISVLEEFYTPFPGFYLYYPARRQASPAFRALIDYLLQLRQAR